MLSGLCAAGGALGRRDYVDAAAAAANFARKNLFDKDRGVLLRSAYTVREVCCNTTVQYILMSVVISVKTFSDMCPSTLNVDASLTSKDAINMHHLIVTQS